jgi:transcription elongation factor Elf1
MATDNSQPSSNRIRLGDDGTMDTVLVCRDCGREFRFNFDVGPLSDETPEYDAWVAGIIAETEAEHVCNAADDDDE